MNVEKWKIYFVALVCALGILFSMPNMMPDSMVKSLPSWMPHAKVPLGLDLQGGSHLLLEVDMKTVDKDFVNQIASVTVDMLKTSRVKASIDVSSITGEERELEIKLEDSIDQTFADKMMNQVGQGLTAKVSPGLLKISISDEAISIRHEEVLNRSLEIVRRRIDEEGTKEPNIQRHGANRILLQMPGIQDPSKVKELLGRTAKMTFQVLDDTLPEIYEGDVRPSKMGVVYLPMEKREPNEPVRLLPVNRRILVNGDSLVDATPGFDNYNNAQVAFRFNAIGAKQFAKATRKNINKRLAIVLDNKVISAPVIREAITGGSGVINGNFSVQEANDLSLLLRSGALPAPLFTIEERTVGPDLGGDSIKAGIIATLIAIVCVFCFMIMEYKILGLFANIALIFNIILLLAALSVMQATLTLPGIAGIALTVGMAVDANVLINERAREELRNGSRPLPALNAGYQMAMKTIVDSNVTTLFGAAALYFLGTGSVRGFAVTLSLGIIISMFTAIYLTKVIKYYWVLSKNGQDIVIP